MVKFIVTTRDKTVSLMKLENIQRMYRAEIMLGTFNLEKTKDYCNDVMLWVVNSLDVSFSNINQVIKDCQYIIDSDILQFKVLNDVHTFVNYIQAVLPVAWGNSEWPSCKDLLKYSDRDIIEKAKDLVVDKNAKKIIQAVLNIETMNDVITAGTLAQYYLEILHSIKMELTLNFYDPHKNKQYILSKALQELHFCNCVMQKTGEKIIEEKMKEYLTAQKEYWEQEDKLFKSNSTILSIYNRISLQQIIGFEN